MLFSLQETVIESEEPTDGAWEHAVAVQVCALDESNARLVCRVLARAQLYGDEVLPDCRYAAHLRTMLETVPVISLTRAAMVELKNRRGMKIFGKLHNSYRR